MSIFYTSICLQRQILLITNTKCKKPRHLLMGLSCFFCISIKIFFKKVWHGFAYVPSKILNMKKIIVVLSIIIIGLQSQAQKVPIIVPPPPPGMRTPPPPPGTKFVVVKPGQHKTHYKAGYYYKNGKYYKRKKNKVKYN